MPLPMVHLAIAVQLSRRQRQELLPDFLLGSIAPDAIHIRPGIDRQDKQRVHLQATADADHHQVRSLFVRHYFDKLKEEPGITPVYITEAMVNAFIEEATEMTDAYLRQWKGMADPGDQPGWI